MEWTGLNELRERYLKFFESKGHTILPSFPLVPKDDNSLLLINSGMAPMKKFFLGVETPPNKRVTTCQKCIRTPDIERVGKTARHGTYFEMLGNFSFGDYFKKEATRWAWEFLTVDMAIPSDLLWISIYEEDDEAFEIWTKEIGVDPSRMVRLGKEDNFWEIGSGPCGPCSEIYFDRGEAYGCGSPDCAPGCDCDRYMEIWNLVFTQFNSDGAGNYEPLEHPNIDTGMGLERLACVMQGVGNLFEVDTVQNIMKHVSDIAGVRYKTGVASDVSLRVITDHIRSTTVMIGDGIVPQNEGRGYVLRRLLRRAARHGRLLGIKEPFLYKVCETVIAENASAYPSLVENRDYIIKVILLEEERFAKTIDQGIELLGSMIEKLEAEAKGGVQPILSGEQAFKLYDTFGFPIDLTREILEERSIGIDEEGFNASMAEQRDRARAARASMADVSWEGDVLTQLESKTEFVGYDTLVSAAKLVAIVVENQLVDSVAAGDRAAIILDTTSFYAESGGQVGDTGVITAGNSIFKVQDCKKSATGQFMHIGEMVSGVLTVADRVQAQVDAERRMDIMRNHSACHLLQQALREVLGTHVHQAGSMVDDTVCRFDFSHFSAMTAEEVARVETLVNEMVLAGLAVEIKNMPIDEAKELGAQALFGEKYGDVVRVANMGGRSIEFCGGTHLENTANVGLFKILKESSVAAGVRRIEAVTGRGVLRLLEENQKLLIEVAQAVKAGSIAELPVRVAHLSGELRSKDREIDSLRQTLADVEVGALLEGAQEVGAITLAAATFPGATPDALRTMAEKLRERAPRLVAVLVATGGEKASVACSSGSEAVAAGIHAGKLTKEVCALVGGSGGGRPDFAMGGATAVEKLPQALAQVPAILEKMLKA